MLQCMSANLWWLCPLQLVPALSILALWEVFSLPPTFCPARFIGSTCFSLSSSPSLLQFHSSYLTHFLADMRSKQRHIDISDLPCLTRSRHISSFPTFSGVGIHWIIPQHELKLALYLHVIPVCTFKITVMHSQTPEVLSRSGVLRSCLHGS